MVNVERSHRPSHGEQIHRREVLAEERRQRPSERTSDEVAETRGEKKLSPDNEAALTPLTRATSQFEEIWLRFKVGSISENERNSCLQKALNDWETSNPEVFDLLTRENGNGMTLLAEIRNKVIPRITIGGYHTKRR